MNTIKTTAPIKIDDLKKYFEDQTTFFEIDYTNSTIKADKLLVYISNLDIPCDIVFSTEQEIEEMLECYLDTSFLTNLRTLELITISLLLQMKGVIPEVHTSTLERLNSKLQHWCDRLDSLPLYNMYTIDSEEFKDWVVDQHEHDDTTTLVGINFVSLLKHEEFFAYYQAPITAPKYFTHYFNAYTFKGKNLYSYWATESNPMFLLTMGIASGEIDPLQYVTSIKETRDQENQNAALV